jgi:hypothetical protein
MRVVERLRNWWRCKHGDHGELQEHVYGGIPMAGAYDYGPEYFDGPWIKMKRIKCQRCHTVVSWEPTTDELPNRGK